MNKVQVLDCTLRDGGYCNEWHFGFENSKKITSGLVEAGIDIIECGFLTNQTDYHSDYTKFNTLEQVAQIIPNDRDGKIFVAMMNYGEYDIDSLPDYDGKSIDGIRVAFHKKNLVNALEWCEQIQKKGYKVFIQAMVSLAYSDCEFLELIRRVNKFKPYAFYIVDSFGMMKAKDLIRLFYMVEHNLDEDIWIGFHSHNNMQLAYSNAQSLITVQTTKNLIIDTSVYGMGRGAGNLNTELFIQYLNENINSTYEIKPLLTIIDEILNDFYQQNYWGYSLPNYISAVHNVHPNYAGYLNDKNTLTIDAMNDIFGMMSEEKKVSYDKNYIEELYFSYMEKDRIREGHFSDLKKSIAAREVLIIAPGKSSLEERDKVIACARREDIISISINHEYDDELTDYIFLSNLRRYRELPSQQHPKCIVTSNIPSMDVYLQVRYKELMNDTEAVQDNAGMMLIKLLINLGVRKVFIAGMDGYSVNLDDNYADKQMNLFTHRAMMESMNKGMSYMLKEYSRQIEIEFLTTPHFVSI